MLCYVLHQMHQLRVAGFLYSYVTATKIQSCGLKPLCQRTTYDVLALDEYHLRVIIYLIGSLGKTTDKGGAHRLLVEAAQYGSRNIYTNLHKHLVDIGISRINRDSRCRIVAVCT